MAGAYPVVSLSFASWLGWFLSPDRASVPRPSEEQALSPVYLPFGYGVTQG